VRKAQNCFLYYLLPTVVASVFVVQIDEVETKILSANSTSEFSHSQAHRVISLRRGNSIAFGPKRTPGRRAGVACRRR
jgi:hypothetical protein